MHISFQRTFLKIFSLIFLWMNFNDLWKYDFFHGEDNVNNFISNMPCFTRKNNRNHVEKENYDLK